MKWIIVIFLTMVTATFVFTQTPSHPRLFFSTSDVLTLQNRATTSGTKAYDLWTQIIRDKEANHFAFGTQYTGGPSNKALII